MYSFAFMNYKNNSVNTIWFKDRGTSFIPKVRKENNQDYLEIYKNGKKDKLIFKYGGFINYNQKPSNHSIEKIEFNGSDDVRGEYQIIIYRNLNASIKISRGYYEKVITKTAETKLKLKDYNKLINLLNYMDFANSKENYSYNRSFVKSELK